MIKKYALPDMEHRFKVQVLGEESKINWAGDFMYRRPTLRERAQVDLLKTRLNGDLLTLDPDIVALNEALAYLRFTLKEYPDWWKDTDFGGDLYDANVILEVYNKCQDFEAAWRRRVMGGQPEAVEAGNGKIEESSLPA